MECEELMLLSRAPAGAQAWTAEHEHYPFQISRSYHRYVYPSSHHAPIPGHSVCPLTQGDLNALPATRVLSILPLVTHLSPAALPAGRPHQHAFSGRQGRLLPLRPVLTPLDRHDAGVGVWIGTASRQLLIGCRHPRPLLRWDDMICVA